MVTRVFRVFTVVAFCAHPLVTWGQGLDEPPFRGGPAFSTEIIGGELIDPEARTEGETRSDQLRAQGIKLYEAQDYDAAIRVLSDAIRLDPRNWAPYYTRGAAWTQKKHWPNAADDLSQALKLNKDAHVADEIRLHRSAVYSCWASTFTAKNLFAKKNPDLIKAADQAISDADAVLKSQPQSMCARRLRVFALVTAGRSQEAKSDAKVANSMRLESAAQLQERARLNFTAGEEAAAKFDALAAVTLDPESPHATAILKHFGLLDSAKAAAREIGGLHKLSDINIDAMFPDRDIGKVKTPLSAEEFLRRRNRKAAEEK